MKVIVKVIGISMFMVRCASDSGGMHNNVNCFPNIQIFKNPGDIT